MPPFDHPCYLKYRVHPGCTCLWGSRFSIDYSKLFDAEYVAVVLAMQARKENVLVLTVHSPLFFHKMIRIEHLLVQAAMHLGIIILYVGVRVNGRGGKEVKK